MRRFTEYQLTGQPIEVDLGPNKKAVVLSSIPFRLNEALYAADFGHELKGPPRVLAAMNPQRVGTIKVKYL